MIINTSTSTSTLTERLFLFVTLALLPMQANLPKVKGFGSLFLVYAGLLTYLLLCRPKSLFRSARHGIFVAAYCFMGAAFIIELAHGEPEIYEMLRLVFMIVGAVIITTLCKDRRALAVGLYGYLLGSLVLSSILLLQGYDRVSSIAATDNFYEMSRSRMDALSQTSLLENLNAISFYASQGVIIALVTAFTAGLTLALHYRILLTITGLVCMTAAFTTMSRTGVVTMVLAMMAVACSYGLVRIRIAVAIMIITLVVLFAIPPAALNRLTFTTEKAGATEHQDSRVRIYEAIVKHLPEYFWTGVGMGQFYEHWGKKTAFARNGVVGGSHSSIAQVTICWGVIGLLLFLRIVWRAYRAFPKLGDRDPVRLCLLGTSVAAAALSLVTHNIEGKEFSVTLGLLAAADLWIWRVRPIRVSSRRTQGFWNITQRTLRRHGNAYTS